MRDFATRFYKSKQWQNTRDSYLSSVNGLCEDCLRKGIYKPAEIVHHIQHIEPWNIDNPEVTLSWANLKAVCRDCHGLEHSGNGKNKIQKRFTIDEGGGVKIFS